jgi:complex iron-sulfur molybdoenzyme family reductase subunit beta
MDEILRVLKALQTADKYKVALPLRSDYGTQPNIYYIPPTESPVKFDENGKMIEGSSRLPMEELVKLFGEEVQDSVKILKDEMAKRKETGNSELLDLLIAYKHSDMFRLDNNYYQQVAHDKGKNPLSPVDTRYIAGKHTPSGHKMNFFHGAVHTGGHH